MDKNFEQVLEWAKCGIYHNRPEGVGRDEALKFLKLVEEKFTSANKQSTPVICPSCKSDVHVNYKCNNCDYTFSKWK